MAFICGDCKQEHPVPTPQEDLDGTPCFDALLRERDSLKLQIGELVAALEHMKGCRSCGEDQWEICEGGRAALAAIEKATVNRVVPVPLVIDTRCPKCKQPVDNVIHFCPAQ